jgi:hypothetical protein
MTGRNPAAPAIRTVRFTPRIARQCSQGNARAADRAVCETIANGSRRNTRRRGSSGGRIVRFERTFPMLGLGGPSSRARTQRVIVLGEMVPDGCIALELISPASGLSEIWDDLGFLNRAGSK